MIKELQYKGYATEPSDYECPDGQLATSLNLINEDGQLKPVFQPKELFSLPPNKTVLFVHNSANYKHYIILDKDTNKLFWLNHEDIIYTSTIEDYLNEIITLTATLYKIDSLGNTLMAFTAEGLEYILWKKEDYTLLGQKPPQINAYFFSHGYEIAQSEERPLSLDSMYVVNPGTTEPDMKLSVCANPLFAAINEVKEKIMEEFNGNFWYPFFVRLAYRTFSGKHIMHTAPFLVVPNVDAKPQLFLRVNNGPALVACLQNVSVFVKLSKIPEEWNDIIVGIDIFLTPQIQAYTEDEAAFPKTTERVSYPNQNEQPLSQLIFGLDGVAAGMNAPRVDLPNNDFKAKITLKRADDKDISTLIREESRYYLYKTIKTEDFEGADQKEFQIKSNECKNLMSKEVLDDDWKSRDTLISKCTFIYNSRLNIAPTQTQFGTPDNIENTTQAYLLRNAADVDTTLDGFAVGIVENGNTFFSAFSDFIPTMITSRSGSETNILPRRYDTIYFFYPNPNAKTVIFRLKTTDYTETPARITYAYGKISLLQHQNLNGAYAFNDDFSPIFNNAQTIGTAYESDEEFYATHPEYRPTKAYITSKLYTSEVNNPFVFPVTSINTIGTGTIIGLSSAVKALSQGQFGQFPLYAFTSDGVWALQTSDTGGFEAKQPTTRDACINTDSITQIDSSVLFATDRGIMLISGSQTQSITDSIFSEAPFNVLDLPGIDQLHTKLGHSADACLPMKPFIGFLAGCKMVYDYVHQRIFVYNPTKVNGSPKYTYAYVFSLKSKMWGMVFTDLASTINDYPRTLAMTHDNKLVSFSETDESETDETVCKGLYITRPLKLEDADVHKTISALIQRGHFQRGDVGTVLYGSRDLYTWHLIWSSKDHYLRGFRGTPYKYFRIAGLATLTEGKSIFGASVNFEPRHTNQLR